jgi:hypothetical protein
MTDPVTLWSLLVGSLGFQAMFAGGWLRWQQMTLEQQKQEEEEDTVTRYDSKDTVPSQEMPKGNGSRQKSNQDPRLVGWEFKIVRAERDLFRDPAVFKQLCEEEESAGWIMLEKLDDRRIRFKRPIALRQIMNPDVLPFDPYRTHYGASSRGKTWLVAIVAIVVLLLPTYLGYMLVSTTLLKSQSGSQMGSPSPSPESQNTAPAQPRKVF